jgi:hypothetical protein
MKRIYVRKTQKLDEAFAKAKKAPSVANIDELMIVFEKYQRSLPKKILAKTIIYSALEKMNITGTILLHKTLKALDIDVTELMEILDEADEIKSIDDVLYYNSLQRDFIDDWTVKELIDKLASLMEKIDA